MPTVYNLLSSNILNPTLDCKQICRGRRAVEASQMYDRQNLIYRLVFYVAPQVLLSKSLKIMKPLPTVI